MQASPTSLEGAVASGKIKATSGNLRYNDLKPEPKEVAVNSEDTLKPLVDALTGKVDDPVGLASILQQSGSEEEAKKQLTQAGIPDDEQGSIWPYILGGAALAGAGGLAYAVAKRKGKKKEFEHHSTSDTRRKGFIGGPTSNNAQAATVDGGELKAARTAQTSQSPAKPPLQIGTDIMSDDKAMTELQRVMMNIGKIGGKRGRIKP